MSATPDKNSPRSDSRGFDRRLIFLIGGALLLIVAGLIAVPLASQRTPTLAAETTPEGVVQRFYQALYAKNYSTAYDYIASETQQKVTLGEMQQSLSYTVDNSQFRTGDVSVDGDTATVVAKLTSYGGGSLFGSSQYTNEQTVLLRREGDGWKIVSGFGVYIQP